MKSLVVSLSLSMFLAGSALTVRGEEPFRSAGSPAATLGKPRATLGLPQAVGTPNEAPAPLAELLKPIARGQMDPVISPYAPITVPDKTIGAGIAEEKTPEKTPSTRVIPVTPVPQLDLDSTLCPLPATAPPFITDPQRFRVSAEYLMWWTRGAYVPPLLTTGPASSNGFLGAPGVSTLLGNGPLDSSFRQGFRTGFVWYCDPCMKWGIDGNFFFLAATGSHNSFSSDGSTLLARPFANLNDGQSFSELIAYPGVLRGGIVVNTGSSLWGADLNARRRLYQSENSRLDLLMGYRHMSLEEHLDIDESSVGSAGTIAQGLNAFAFDRFRTSNNFNGGQIGVAYEKTHGRWVLDLRAKVALGITSQTVDIEGGQTLYNANGTATNYQGGLLALNSNIGHHTKSEFSVVPEFTMNLGYNITQRCRVFVGYNFLYWTNVVRPGTEIDPNLDINRIPNFTTSANGVNGARPMVQFHEKDYWAMGLNFGFMFRW